MSDQLAQGKYQEAIVAFTQSLALNAEDADAFYNRAYAHHSLGQYDKAIADYGQAIAPKT